MNVSTRGRYALRALTHLAKSYETDDNKPVSIKTICSKENISNRYLENIFVTLRKADIIKSLKGEKGGFYLAKKPSSITIYDVLAAVETEMSPSKCVVDVSVCDNAKDCGMRKIWVKIDSNIKKELRQTNLLEVSEVHIK
jgi:Rrf2 family cysteine metabolism transcriptional repressor